MVENPSINALDANTEIIIDLCMNNQIVREQLEKAVEFERKFAEGMSINNGTALLKGQFDPRTGLLTAKLELAHGVVVYQVQDPTMNRIKISSIPDTKCIESPYELSEDDLAIIQAEFTNVIEVDFRDFESIKEAKEKLANDYVLKHQVLNTPERSKASDLAIWHLRAYRRIYQEYYNEFNFLWIHSKLKSASSLYAEVLRRGSKS